MDYLLILSKKGCVKFMYKIAVIGDKDSVLAFRALGVHVFTAIEGNDARRIIDKLAKDIPETIQRYNSEVIPAVILIPSNRGSLNIGLENINKNVEKAVGSNIL